MSFKAIDLIVDSLGDSRMAFIVSLHPLPYLAQRSFLSGFLPALRPPKIYGFKILKVVKITLTVKLHHVIIATLVSLMY